jgi:hypothetical protein
VLNVFVGDDVRVGEVEFEKDGGADLRVNCDGRVGDLCALVSGRGPEGQVSSVLRVSETEVIGRMNAMLCVPRCHPDVNILDLNETFCINGCIIGRGDESFHGLVGFKILFADLQFGRRRLEMEDWLAGEEATRGLFVVF